MEVGGLDGVGYVAATTTFNLDLGFLPMGEAEVSDGARKTCSAGPPSRSAAGGAIDRHGERSCQDDRVVLEGYGCPFVTLRGPSSCWWW